MTTITRLKQLRNWIDGKLKEERVQRQPQPALPTPTTLLYALSEYVPDRFASYREKIIPKLRICGYGYFLSCASNDYVEHQKWCEEHCIDSSLPHCDVWQIDVKYPRAFANKEDAAMFKITFDARNIE
jgi:hypothetical protein